MSHREIYFLFKVSMRIHKYVWCLFIVVSKPAEETIALIMCSRSYFFIEPVISCIALTHTL